ncbi:MAG: DUF896 domain-containing protein [Lactobacillus sp.]|nr:DUF896 domain-containing protein [Lactobacillus sp.]
MNQEIEKITARINALYKKKQESGLTEAEEAERKELHKKFLENFRAGFRQQVEDLVIVNKDGKEVTSEKVKKIQRERGLRKD